MVVGVDGSPASIAALEWALGHHGTGSSPRVVTVYGNHEIGLELDGVRLASPAGGTSRADAEAVQAAVLADHPPELVETAKILRGHAGFQLVTEAVSARLLVLGSRPSGAGVTHLAPVTSYCARHSDVPLAVIPEGGGTDAPLCEVVVGLDGSDNSVAALRWAAHQLAPGGSLVAVAAWDGSGDRSGHGSAAEARAMLEHCVSDASAGGALPSIDLLVARGRAGHVLREASRGRDLLVTGRRGRHGTDYVRVGSVTTSLLHHPITATVLVPPRYEFAA